MTQRDGLGRFHKPSVRRDLQAEHAEEHYNRMLYDVAHAFCWACGRDESWAHKPPEWYGPWLIHRAHIVSKPRALDRRAAVLLCPVCHGISHGARFGLKSLPRLPALTVANLLWLKHRFDSDFYDRAFLQRHCVGNLPQRSRPGSIYFREIVSRRGPEFA